METNDLPKTKIIFHHAIYHNMHNTFAKNIYLSLESFALAAFEGNAPAQEENDKIVADALEHYAKKTRQPSNAVQVVLLPEPTIN